MIKINDLVKVIDRGYEVDDLDTEAISIFAGEIARVVKVINDNTVKIEFLNLSKEEKIAAERERVNIALITDLELI